MEDTLNDRFKDYEKVIKESQDFRSECAKLRALVRKSRQQSMAVQNRLRTVVEESVIVMEELITLKHDALAIVEVSYHGMTIADDEPLYISCEEERQFIRKAISDVRNTVASEQVPLTSRLMQKFQSLSYLSTYDTKPPNKRDRG